MFFDSVASFIVGLVSNRLYRETRSLFWVEKATQCTSEMKSWAEKGSEHNFQHKYYLLEAESHYSKGNFQRAEIFYHKAIEAAIEHKFTNDVALAYEIVARFYYETGDAKSALAHYKLAHHQYNEWGATSKADKLFMFMEEKFSNSWSSSSPGVLESTRDTRKRRPTL